MWAQPFFFLIIRRPPRSTQSRSSAASDVYKRQVLINVAENFEAEVKLRGKIKSAMTYPVMVFIMAILATTGMLLFIVPVFAEMFAGLGGQLPLPTQILVYLSQAMKIAAPILLVATIVFS